MLPGDERDTLRELLTALRSGQLVMFAVDRWVMGPSDTWPLFGAPARLPTAPFALAARSDAPVFLMIPWRVGFNRIEAVVEVVTPERMPSEDGGAPASGGEARGDREAAIARMRQRVYPILERYINEHPEQWVSALSTVWDDAKGNVDRPTIVERSVEHAAEATR
jgi:lauroyl/myristoyl acyltransferase